jgi:hypothetical protein
MPRQSMIAVVRVHTFAILDIACRTLAHRTGKPSSSVVRIVFGVLKASGSVIGMVLETR